MTATLDATAHPSKPVTARERRQYLRAFRARGWSQNRAAGAIGKNPGHFSKWLRGEFASAPMRLALDAILAEVPTEGAPR